MNALFMRLVGFLLLLTGWLAVLAGSSSLNASTRSGAILAGLAIQAVGIFLVVRSHLPPKKAKT
jgi:hypothetical protein